MPKRRTYNDFLAADCGNTFAEFLGINAPTFEWVQDHRTGQWGWKMKRWAEPWAYGRETIEGEIKPTKKGAKASYKEALAKHHRYIAMARVDAGCD